MTTRFDDPAVFNSAVTFNGATVLAGGLTLPDAIVTSAKVVTGANLSADKLQHRHALHYAQNNGVDVVAATAMLHIAHAAGTIRRIVVRPTTVPTGGDKQYTVDVQKAANASGTWTSLLTSVITISSADANNTQEVGTLIATPTYVTDEAIRVVVAVSGTTGSQGQGFVVGIIIDENGT